jgi:hypothetical protein
MISNESKKLARLVVLLRIYGVITLVIFGSLLLGSPSKLLCWRMSQRVP